MLPTNHRTQAAQTARQWLDQHPLYLDTETTGLDDTAQICDLAIVDHNGATLLDTLIKPTIPIPKGARDVHGISDADVAHAPTFAQIVPRFVEIVGNRPLVIYNRDYDTRLLRQSATVHGLRLSKHFGLKTMHQFNQWYNHWHCAMKLYAQFHGEWNDHRDDYRWQKLANAARQCHITVPPDLHRARADAELTRLVLLHVARETPVSER
ncbi:MAG: 3'-5' exonuclease [Chloroflexi bacterium]|nr:3'-5' exonuclease [Chloroflexota bacterium]